MELSPQAQRVLGCLVEKALATPNQYPLSLNALTSACNQRTGRDPVVDWDEAEVRSGIDDLKQHQLVRTEYARGSRVPKTAHRLAEQLDLEVAEQAVLALLLLRGPQTAGELRTRAGRLHDFADIAATERALQALSDHRFGAMAELLARQPGQKEPRWRHLLGGDVAAGPPASPRTAVTGRHLPFRAAVEAGDMPTAISLLADDVVFHSPAVHRPYEGREATGTVLAAVATVLEDFRYVDTLDAGDRVALLFEARVGDRNLQGLDHLVFDDAGRITHLTVMLRPLTGLQAVVERMRDALART